MHIIKILNLIFNFVLILINRILKFQRIVNLVFLFFGEGRNSKLKFIFRACLGS